MADVSTEVRQFSPNRTSLVSVLEGRPQRHRHRAQRPASECPRFAEPSEARDQRCVTA